MRFGIVDELKSLLVAVVLTVSTGVAAFNLMGGVREPFEDLDRDHPHVINAGEMQWEPRVPSGN